MGAEVAVTSKQSFIRRRAAWLLFGVVFLVFAPSLLCGFVFDDLPLLVENRYAQSLEYVPRSFVTHFWNTEWLGQNADSRRYYRPLVMVSYIVNWVASGGSAWAFHLVNVLLHASNAALVFVLVRRWLGHAGLALAVALIFGLHPTRTESVIWISGRTDLLMSLFLLLGLWCAHRAAESLAAPRAESDGPGSRAALAWVGGSYAAFVAALLSKEPAIVAPVLYFAVMQTAPKAGRRLLFRLLLVVSATTLVYVSMRLLVFPLDQQESGFYPLYGLMTVGSYVKRTVWPWPQTLFPDPLLSHDGELVFDWVLVGIGSVALLGAAALVYRSVRKDRVAAAFLIAAFVLLGPLLNFTYSGIQVTASDRFLYLPLCCLLVGGIRQTREFVSRYFSARPLRLAALGLLSVFAAVDVARVPDFFSNQLFWEHERSVRPDNPVALRWEAKAAMAQGELEQARSLLIAAIEPSGQHYALLNGAVPRAMSYAYSLVLEAAQWPDGAQAEIVAVLDVLSRYRTGEAYSTTHFATLERLTPPSNQLSLDREPVEDAAERARMGDKQLGGDPVARDKLRAVHDRLWSALPHLAEDSRLTSIAGGPARRAPGGSKTPPEIASGGRDFEIRLTEEELTRLRERCRYVLLAESAVLASRLGDFESVRRWVSQIEDDEFVLLPQPANIVLALARASEFAEAERRLDVLQARTYSEGLRSTLPELRNRIARAKRHMTLASNAKPLTAAEQRGIGLGGLGAYHAGLLAVVPELTEDRLLKLGPLVLQLLVSSRYQAEARRFALAAMGAAQADSVLTALHASLPEVLRNAPPAVFPSQQIEARSPPN